MFDLCAYSINLKNDNNYELVNNIYLYRYYIIPSYVIYNVL